MTTLKHRISEPVGRWILVATVLASSMAFIDGTALNLVLPNIQTELGATGAQLLWIVNAYLLLLASFILLGGALGDYYGRKRVFGIGIIIFAISSLACGLAPTVDWLIIARGVKGFGGALMVPGSLAIISASFAADERGQAIGIWSSASTITTLGGPILGGALASAGLWRFVFFINLPLALLALYALAKTPESRNAKPQRLDIPGATLVALALATITYGLVTMGDLGVDTALAEPSVIISLVVGLAAFVGFLVIEARSSHPMMDLKLFRSRDFSGANAMTAFLYGALTGSLLFLPLNLIQVQGYDPSIAGFTLLPFTILLALLSPYAGRLLPHLGPRRMLTVGPLVVGIGFLLISFVGLTDGPSDYWTTFLPAILVMGLGMGITVAPLTATVMGAVPSEHAGIASGINNAVTRSAQVLATAVFGAIALVVFSASLSTETASVTMSETERSTLQVSSRDLGNTTIPQGLSEAAQTQVEMAIKVAFVGTFQVIARIAAAMCFISAVLAAFIIEGRKQPSMALAER